MIKLYKILLQTTMKLYYESTTMLNFDDQSIYYINCSLSMRTFDIIILS